MGRLVLALALFGVVLLVSAEKHGKESCTPSKIVVYKTTITTYWSQQRFPKQYPLWRPPAQFSKFMGLSHNSSVHIWRTGEKSTPAVQQVAERADFSGLETISQGDPGIMDQFIAPAVHQGEGTTDTQVFLDGLHSQISLVSKIVPSPDWFIGVDSLDLCEHGHWLNSVDVKLYPMDAGTDQGLAFTSPNWESVPHEPIYQITNRKPDHPAGSFQYPDLESLPPIANVHFQKVRSYKLAHEFHHPNTIAYTVDAEQPDRVHIVTSTERSVDLPGIQVSSEPTNDSRRAALYADGSVSQVALQSDSAPQKIDGLRLSVIPVQKEDQINGVKVRAGDRAAIIDKIATHYSQKRKSRRRRRRKHLKRKRGPRNCKVGPWSEWGRCSRACGIGEMTRTRPVIRHARRGGKPCPPLVQQRWCGSARSCDKRYFNW